MKYESVGAIFIQATTPCLEEIKKKIKLLILIDPEKKKNGEQDKGGSSTEFSVILPT